MVDFSLKGKYALITGASRGIGEAIAMALGQYGAHCILVSRKMEALEAVAAKMKEKGYEATPIACNMGYVDKVDALFAEVKERFGKIDILVNNAAANPYFGDMLGADEGVWDKTWAVNVKGPFFMIQYAAKLMMETQTKGAIVNVASIAGIRPAEFQGIYSTTKAALIHLTKAYAKELAPHGIRVNGLAPGLTETKFASALFTNKEIYDHATSAIPMHRHAVPEEMAGTVLYLVSDASSFTTGEVIVVDGGMVI
ncbi:NAD(P)-dependent dehydrogenase, short-chain alcohol dehydrogenase family [Desulfatibacillum alkenivorans DSM 16219]|jgi:NAD(P)-dependent dehydrogenase (short-subunit alcohol dehydrogenase family)|uniref:NAD(P)-dependent dehydrogenase, short-chain alcohol dehydrogenase family n=1 Tax=Desulfatibacillum alkenivorans DSM 16219 TaxID=1121393 RepID=A0A1M6FR73_9BACT|nr:SDR family oxidoreductase [Desulfatibacillum alkenivorans]SHJ00192.1 NAD(P)-dependent dehydrogenase, short-chain alcohol dehydrogenase family [Desulfatibacillum alkenivorans DSM 16219]